MNRNKTEEIKYCLIQDNDCHWYVVPVDKKEEAYAYFEKCENYEPAEFPDFLVEVGGSPSMVRFPSFEIQ